MARPAIVQSSSGVQIYALPAERTNPIAMASKQLAGLRFSHAESKMADSQIRNDGVIHDQPTKSTKRVEGCPLDVRIDETNFQQHVSPLIRRLVFFPFNRRHKRILQAQLRIQAVARAIIIKN